MTSLAHDETAAVEAVVFDVGRVLVEWRIAGLYERLIPDAAHRGWFLGTVVTEAWHMQHDAGKPLAEMIAELSAAYPDEHALIEAYGTHWLETVPGTVPGTHALVRALADRGVPLYAITNFGVDTWAMFRPTFPVLDAFRDIVVSGSEAMVKPDRAIFDLAAARFGHAPEAMLFIDDNHANIAAASALGWQTHLFAHHLGAAAADLLAADLRGRGLIG